MALPCATLDTETLCENADVDSPRKLTPAMKASLFILTSLDKCLLSALLKDSCHRQPSLRKSLALTVPKQSLASSTKGGAVERKSAPVISDEDESVRYVSKKTEAAPRMETRLQAGTFSMPIHPLAVAQLVRFCGRSSAGSLRRVLPSQGLRLRNSAAQITGSHR
jgi:hypothetical protein